MTIQRAEQQNAQQQNQSAIQQRGKAVASPQGEGISQLEALVESGPDMEKQGLLAARVNDSPVVSAQRKFAEAINASPRQAVQRKKIDSLFGPVQREEAKEPLQPKVAQRQEAPAKPNNTGLPDTQKSVIESQSGIPIDSARVIYNSTPRAKPHVGGSPLQLAKGTSTKAKTKQQGNQKVKKAKALSNSQKGQVVKKIIKNVKKIAKNMGTTGKTTPYKTMKVKNTTDNYVSAWIDQLRIKQGVQAGPAAEAKKLEYILGAGHDCVGGHMINDQMGGDGGYGNIIPITKEMNKWHTSIENMVTQNLSTALPSLTKEYRYSMRVSNRGSVSTVRGKVTNWPWRYDNMYEVRDKNTHNLISATKAGKWETMQQHMYPGWW